ncbi:MAG: sigma-54-dependent Fis family transcriptional regulator [Phycisphaerales bacterium]|nr:MAG: sigma-54-dependent Fis family transcriptional regulator [Phycisphaerales bacterium]
MSQTAFVLIVESAEEDSRAIAEAVRRLGHAANVAPDAAGAIESAKVRPPDVVLAPWRLNGDVDGDAVLRQIAAAAPDCEILLLVDEEDEPQVRSALAESAHARLSNYLLRPVDPAVAREKIRLAALRATATRASRAMREQVEKGYDYDGIIGISERLEREVKRAAKLARSKSTVLIAGETGTGKELLAQFIHNRSPRAGRPFKPFNCAAVSETLIESELFGHVKGAFTGAVADRKGLLHAADGGTIFLDEIGDMPPAMQAKLLRTLENGEVIPVGSNELVYLDVRFIAATNRDLNELVKEGKFRDDLFYRLHAQGAIRIPPLRDRREDIPVLVTRFIEAANRENGLHIEGITPDALRRLVNYDWPGNVRELRNIVERMCFETENSRLDVADLPDAVGGSREIVAVGPLNWAGLSMADVERLHIMNTLRMCGGNRERAAKVLKIGTRTLYRRLREYGIT